MSDDSEVGSAISMRQADGTVTACGDPLILVNQELLDNGEPWVWDGETLQLDTAGEFRYRQLRPGAHPQTYVFERIDA